MGAPGAGRLRRADGGRVTDTQLPRYFVFKQDAAADPLLNCGAIHAPDPELALMTARDVFVRRPACVSLWVVPADELLMQTREEADGAAADADAGAEADGFPFAIFVKWDHRSQHAYAGQVDAPSAQAAMAAAWKLHADRSPVAIWVAPLGRIVRSQPDDADSWFTPADEKPYRHGSFYHTQSLMREIKSGVSSTGQETDES